MKTLIETIVSALVDHPDAVVVTVKEEADRIVYVLSVHKEDMGKVIGKQGRVAGYNLRGEQLKQKVAELISASDQSPNH